jgi:glutamate/tyrosine decarboxylase-like PLP-dependent enzyme
MVQHKDSLMFSSASPERVAEDLAPLLNFQDKGLSLDDLSNLIDEKLVPHFTKYDRPEFHSLYNCFPEAGAELGGRIALQYNQGVTNWQVSPGGVMLEELCCRTMCRMLGLSPDADATFMYCGTYANQQALYLALHRKAERYGFDLSSEGLKGFDDPSRLVVVASREAHFSLKHAVRILGLGDSSLFIVPVDSNRRMDIERLKNTVHSLQNEGKEVVCIVATAGTTSTGSIDPIIPVVELSKEVEAWSHVDGAYGLAFRFVPEYKPRFDGIERADSVCWDPHKAFGAPIPNSMLFVNRKEDFHRMAIYGEYFNRKDDPQPNPGLKSPPSTRPLSALPLVTSIRHLGMRKMIEKLRAPLTAIKKLHDNLQGETDIELIHIPDTAILCIRVVPEGFPQSKLDDLQKFIHESIKKEGKRSISMTRVDDKTVLRFVAISHNVTEEAMMATVEEARRLAKKFIQSA